MSRSTVHSGEILVQMAETVPDDTTDKSLPLSLDVSALEAFALKASVDMTVKTNSSGSPQETFVLSAGELVLWESGDSAIFAGDVTELFVTNDSGADGTLTLIALSDA